MSYNKVTIDDILKYKNVNKELLPEVVIFYNNNKVKFNKSNNWKRPEIRQNENWLILNKIQQSDSEKLYSQYRSILNKLSDSNFDSLAKEITDLEINKKEHLEKLTELIFNKAIIECKFCLTYAKLAKELVGYCVVDEVTKEEYYFRELLINRCQMMFNECISFDPNLDNKFTITKDTTSGCMTFIGELYNCNLLTNKIINSCLLLLLMRYKKDKTYIINNISILLRTVGNNFCKKCPHESEDIYKRINQLVDSGNLSFKEKFALMDLIDLKEKNKW